MPQASALILDILKQEHSLKIGFSEEAAPAATLRHYTQVNVSFSEIESLCHETVSLINKTRLKSENAGHFEELRKTGQLLWEQLLPRQVKEKLKGSAACVLVLSLDEELIHIPWELLYDGLEFLCLKFDLGRLVFSRKESAEIRYRNLCAKPRMLILANPNNDLKSAYAEGLSIKSQFERRNKIVSIDFKSSRIDSIFVKRNLCDYDIVHFAGHCDYENDRPENSGWVLSDGRFSIENILNMGQAACLPALIFSNACYSAKEDPYSLRHDYQEKNYSMAAAFLHAGVRHYIGAVVRIEDQAGSVFARHFYSQLLCARSLGESLRLARAKVIKEYGKESLYWLNYLLYGDPRFVLFKPKESCASASKVNFKAANFLRRKIKPLLLFISLTALAIIILFQLPTLRPATISAYLGSRSAFRRGDNRSAISLAEGLLKNDRLFLAAYPLLADAYQRMGQKERARQYYFDYIVYSQKKGDKKALASAYLKLGWFHFLDGEYSKAEEFYRKALRLSQLTRNALNEAEALRMMAVWHIEKGEFGKALELLTRSSVINSEHQRYGFEFRKNLACDYFDIGLVFVNKNEFSAAKKFYEKSRSIFEKLQLKNELSDCYFNLGEIYLLEKEYQKALENYLLGLKIDERQANKANLAGDFNMLGELYMEMGDFENAEKYFLRALSLSEEIYSKPDIALVCYNLGVMYKSKGRKNKVREYWRKAQEIYNTIDPAKSLQIKGQLLSLDTPS